MTRIAATLSGDTTPRHVSADVEELRVGMVAEAAFIDEVLPSRARR
jgi:hypothetical protein